MEKYYCVAYNAVTSSLMIVTTDESVRDMKASKLRKAGYEAVEADITTSSEISAYIILFDLLQKKQPRFIEG